MSETLALRALLERTSLRPGKREEMHLLVDIKAIGAPVDSARPALSVVFVLDVSGSMQGPPLEQVISSVGMLVDLLAPEDKVGVVSFSDEAAVVAEIAPLSVEHKRVLKRRVQSMHTLGGTNIEAGLVKAKAIRGARTAHERQVILLLSDGAPNAGASTPDALAAVVETMRNDVSVSTLGYGAGHNADVLHATANAGGGQYWFIPDPQEASLEFARAIGAQGDIVADGVELVIAPADAVEVADVLGTKTRFGKLGPVASLPDLREKQSRLVVAKLVVTAPLEPGKVPALDVIVKYRAAGHTAAQELKAHVSVDVVDKEPQLVVEVHQAAMMAKAEIVRKEARAAADRRAFDQAAGALRAMIKELEAVPGYKPADGSPLSECVEQLIDEATEYEQRPSAERLAAFKATQMGIDVAQGSAHASKAAASSSRSMAVMHGATGDAPPGHILVKNKGGGVLSQIPLQTEMTVGRSPDNEIAVSSGSLSRRHSRFVCRNGKVLIVDLKSTNGTYVNGKRVDSPQVLTPGDKVSIGDLVFELHLDKP